MVLEGFSSSFCIECSDGVSSSWKESVLAQMDYIPANIVMSQERVPKDDTSALHPVLKARIRTKPSTCDDFIPMNSKSSISTINRRTKIRRTKRNEFMKLSSSSGSSSFDLIREDKDEDPANYLLFSDEDSHKSWNPSQKSMSSASSFESTRSPTVGIKKRAIMSKSPKRGSRTKAKRVVCSSSDEEKPARKKRRQSEPIVAHQHLSSTTSISDDDLTTTRPINYLKGTLDHDKGNSTCPTTTTRSGRTIVEPIKYWEGEKVFFVPVKDELGVSHSVKPVVAKGFQSILQVVSDAQRAVAPKKKAVIEASASEDSC